MKRYLLLILCLLALLLVAIPVYAEDDGIKESGGYRYSVNEDGTATILGSSLVYGDVIIPSSLDGRTVTAIGPNAFQDTDSIISVTIPGTVKTVESCAFENCEFLESVTLCEGVTSLGRSAFGLCPLLEYIHIPASLQEVLIWNYGSNGPFQLSSLQQVTFAPGRTEIPAWLFEGTSMLESVTIPDTVTFIGEHAFQHSGLKAVIFSSAGRLTTIEPYAFNCCEMLEELALPEGLTSIGNDAFANAAALKQVSFPSTLHTIESCAFLNCTSLTGARLNEGLSAIGYRAFGSCTSLTYAHIPASLTQCITTNYGSSGPFQLSGLTDVTFGEGTTRVVEHLLEETPQLTSVILPDTVTEIGERAFRVSGLTHIWLGSGLQTIQASAFAECENLGSPIFPEGLTTVGDQAFQNCASLWDPQFPESLRTIGNEAFKNCDTIERAVLNHGLEVIGRSAFADCDRLFQTYIPASLQRVTTWSYSNNGPFTNSSLRSILFEEGVTVIPDHLFDSCPKLKGLRLPDTIVKIGEDAFANCKVLNDITMPRDLERLEWRAFYNCKSLTRVSFDENLSYLHTGAFSGCEDLTALFFSGPAPTIATDTAFPKGAILYYLEGQEGWTTPYYPDPEEEFHPTAPIMGNVDLMDEDFLNGLSRHTFSFIDWTGAPLDQVTVSFGEYSYSSGDASTVNCIISGEDDTLITFSREGYRDLTLPPEVLRGSSTIRLFSEKWTTPYVECLYARDEDGFIYDLINDGLTLFSLDTVELSFYTQINPMYSDDPELSFSSSADTEDALFTLYYGWSEPRSIHPSRIKDSGPYALLTSDGDTAFRQVLRVTVTEPPKEVKVATGSPIQLASDWLDPLFQPGSAQLGIDLFDNLKVSYKTVGADQFEVYIGFDPSNTWSVSSPLDLSDTFEKTMLDMEDDMNSFADMVKSLGKTYELNPTSAVSSRLMVDCTGLLVGYGTGSIQYDEAGEPSLVLEKISFGVELGGSFKGRKQMMIGSHPVYISSEISTKNSFLANAQWLSWEEGIVPLDSTFSGTTGIKGRAGLGWDQLLSAGIYGAVNLDYNCPLPLSLEALSISASGSLGLDAAILFLDADVELIKTENLNLKEGSSQLASMYSMAPGDFDWQPQSRDYLSSPSPLNASVMVNSAVSPDVSGETLLTGVYPRTAVQFAELPDGRLLAVWVADDGTRADTNRSTLYYMVGDGESWSVPAPVDEDGTADFQPVLYAADGAVWLLWQDAAQPLTSYDLVESASLLDLCCACFDGSSFEVLGGLGTEGCYDGGMSLTTLDGQPAVYYFSDAAGDLLAVHRTVDLHRAVWNGKTWVDELLLEGLDTVDQTASMGSTVWFTAETESGRELFRYDGTLTRLTNDEIPDSNPSVAGGTLVWFRDGTLTDGQQQIPMDSDTTRYQYLQSGNQEVLLWAVRDAQSFSTLYACFRDGDTWGEPVMVDGGNGYIASFHGSLLNDGTLSVLVSERGVILPDDSEDPYALSELTPAAELRLYRASLNGSLRLNKADYLSATLAPGMPLVLQLDVTNTGARTVTAVEITVCDGDTVLSSGVYTMELLSGQNDLLAVQVPLGSTVSEELTVTVTPVGMPDGDLSDNTQTLGLKLTDLALEKAEAVTDETSVTVTVLAANRGFAEIGEAVLYLTDENGGVLATETIQNLQPGDSISVAFHPENLLEGASLLYISAEELSGENCTSNNRLSVTLVTADQKAAGMLAAPQVVSDGESSGTVTVIATFSANVGGTVTAASYDEHGRFLGAVTAWVEADTGTVTLEGLPAGHSYRLFFTDGSYVPLCPTEPLN